MIVQDLAGQFWKVRNAGADLDHVWLGVAVKRAGGAFVPKAKAREILVRRFGCTLVREG